MAYAGEFEQYVVRFSEGTDTGRFHMSGLSSLPTHSEKT